VIADHLITDRGVSAGDDWIAVAPDNVRSALSGLRDEGY